MAQLYKENAKLNDFIVMLLEQDFNKEFNITDFPLRWIWVGYGNVKINLNRKGITSAYTQLKEFYTELPKKHDIKKIIVKNECKIRTCIRDLFDNDLFELDSLKIYVHTFIANQLILAESFGIQDDNTIINLMREAGEDQEEKKQKRKQKLQRRKEKKREERSKIKTFVRITRPQPGKEYTGIKKVWDVSVENPVEIQEEKEDWEEEILFQIKK